MKKIIVTILSLAMALSMLALTACGGTKPADPTEAVPAPEAVTTVEETSEELQAVADFSEAAIEIAYGDVEAITDLAKKAQNFEIEEGAVVKIDGIFSEGVMTPSIVEDDGKGGKMGITMYIDGDAEELPADGADIEVTGSFVKGGLFMEFHVPAENIIVK